MDLFQKNIGKLDRKIRIGVGAVLVLLALFGILGAWAWIGIIPLATGLINSCPVYTLIGKNTLEK